MELKIKDELVKGNVIGEEKIFIQAGRRCGKDWLTLLIALKSLGIIKSLNVVNEFTEKEL